MQRELQRSISIGRRFLSFRPFTCEVSEKEGDQK